MSVPSINPGTSPDEHDRRPRDAASNAEHCPSCGAALIQERCKVVCRSAVCHYRIIYNCSEF